MRWGRRCLGWRHCPWLEVNAHLVEEAGLPEDVLASQDKFNYFVDKTYGQDGWLSQAP